jgi:hypothetical protein
MLRLIGYWKGSLRDEYPFPQELGAGYAPDIRQTLLTFLESGEVFQRYRGYSWCRFGCPEPNGSVELTDGRWVWPEGLAHYIRRHPVALPAEFLRDVADKNRLAGAPRGKPDHSYWIDWARSYRVRAVETLLDEARASAARTCEAIVEAKATRRTALEGLGTTSCIAAGCGRQVVAGKVFCAGCLAERDRENVQASADVRELKRVIDLLPGALPSPPLQRT